MKKVSGVQACGCGCAGKWFFVRFFTFLNKNPTPTFLLLCLPTKNTTGNHSLLLFSTYLKFCKPFLLPSRSLSRLFSSAILLNLFLALSSLPTQSGCLVKSMLNCGGLGEAVTSVLLPQPVTATSIPCKKGVNQHKSLVLTYW